MMHVYGAEDHLLVISDAIDAEEHQHAFIQVTLGLEDDCEVVVAGQTRKCPGLIINANVVHQIRGTGQPLLLLLMDGTSDRAARFRRMMDGRPFHLFPPDRIREARDFVRNMHAGITGDRYPAFLEAFLLRLGVELADPPVVDPRIRDLLHRIRHCTDIGHSVRQYARELGLSDSRLSHLFKENTGISLSGHLVLHKLQKAVCLIFEGMSITEAAMAAGFDSPSHFAATGKRLLGMTAREIRKDSRFLKVSCLP